MKSTEHPKQIKLIIYYTNLKYQISSLKKIQIPLSPPETKEMLYINSHVHFMSTAL